MVAIVQKRNSEDLSVGLIPLLSKLSKGTDMATFAKIAKRKTLEGSDELSTFLAVQDNSEDFMGCLLRIDMEKDEENKTESDDDAGPNDRRRRRRPSNRGFSVMLVSPEAQGKGIAQKLIKEAHPAKTSVRLVTMQTPSRYLCAVYQYCSKE